MLILFHNPTTDYARMWKIDYFIFQVFVPSFSKCYKSDDFNFACKECNMAFSAQERLERHVKKAHPPKRRTDQKPSSDFNHAFTSTTHFLASDPFS